jgi:hypothetical protein
VDPFTDKGSNAVFRNAAQAKAPEHKGSAVGYVGDRFIGVSNYFLHVLVL